MTFVRLREADRFPIRVSLVFNAERSALLLLGCVMGRVKSRLSPVGLGAGFRLRSPPFHILTDSAGHRPRSYPLGAGASELAFVDPSIPDLGTVLCNLRPEVEAVVLDREVRPARQMAMALEGRDGLDAVHVIAHGAPGRVSFAAGEWSAETLARDAAELASIGAALAESRGLLLWSCNAGAGVVGTNFVEALSDATGAPVAAATGLVGSAEQGGVWKLNLQTRRAAARPPLGEVGMVNYAAVLAVPLISTGKGERLTIFGRWPAGTAAGTYFVVLNDGGTLNVIGQFIVPANFGGTFAISEALPAGRYVVGPSTPGPNTIAVYNGTWHPAGNNAGSWSVSDFNTAITASLNNTVEVIPGQSDRGV